MKLCLFLRILFLSSWNHRVQGIKSQMAKEVDRAETEPKCSNPTRNVGDTLLNGCDKKTCIKIKNKAGWIEEFAYENCCWQNQIAYKIGATFSSDDQDTGISTTLRCAQTSSGSPHIVVDDSNTNCQNQESAQQLKDINDELRNTNAKVEEIGSEIKHVKDLLVSVLLIIHPCAVTNPCLDADPCGPYSICNCTGDIARCSCKPGHQGSPPTCEQQPNLLYLSNTKIVELPSLTPVTNCSVPPYPVTGLRYAVTGIVDRHVLICGGQAPGKKTSCHALVGGKWTPYPDMLQNNRMYGASSMTEDGFLVTGGIYTSVQTDRLSSTEYFSSGQWVAGPALPVAMTGGCQVTVGTVVFVAGGKDNSAKLASVYQLESGVWSKVCDMAQARDQHACVAMEGNLYMIGGYRTQFSVEIMKISTKERKAGPRLDKGFSGGQAFVHNSSIYLVYKEGNVIKLKPDGWEYVANVGWIGWRPVYPAPLVTADILGCQKMIINNNQFKK